MIGQDAWHDRANCWATKGITDAHKKNDSTQYPKGDGFRFGEDNDAGWAVAGAHGMDSGGEQMEEAADDGGDMEEAAEMEEEEATEMLEEDEN